jgi:SSS family solute:Na+ symporter
LTTILVVFFLYSAAVIAFGIYMSRGKQGTGADFLLAGRSLGVLLLVGTLFGTIVGVGSSMGAAGLGYSSGIMGGLFLIGGGIGIYLTGLAFTKIRKYRVVTMAEEASVYFGGNKLINGLLSILMSLAEIGWTAVAIIGAATYIEWILGIPLVWSRVISTLLFGTYIIIGGYLAVVWTDLIQSIILGAGFLTAAILGVRAVGGWSGMANALPESYLSFGSVGIMAMLGLLANQILSPMAILQSQRELRKSRLELQLSYV